ncbi:hypothetical protein HXZ66_11685 [Bacillus sp. A116_S68]|jgi:hypothetical protein|nr:hypothetical protein HXZ66_11685 [Bacillus sp. A116_S68]
MFSFFLVISLLSACSYREFEDSLKGKLNKDDEEEIVNTVTLPETASDNEDNSLFSIGDTIRFTNVEDETVEYTLHHVIISDNINDLGLDKSDFNDRSLIEDDGTVDGAHQLVTVDIRIKNKDSRGFDFDEDQNRALLFVEPAVGFKDGIEDPDGPFLLHASYFSDHSPLDQNQGQDYYKFLLGIGEEIDVTVGWFVPTDLLEEELLYYIIGYEGHAEDFQYFQLTLDGGFE